MTTVIKPTKQKEGISKVPALNNIPDIPNEPEPSFMPVENVVAQRKKEVNCSTSINEVPAKKSTNKNCTTATNKTVQTQLHVQPQID